MTTDIRELSKCLHEFFDSLVTHLIAKDVAFLNALDKSYVCHGTDCQITATFDLENGKMHFEFKNDLDQKPEINDVEFRSYFEFTEYEESDCEDGDALFEEDYSSFEFAESRENQLGAMYVQI